MNRRKFLAIAAGFAVFPFISIKRNKEETIKEDIKPIGSTMIIDKDGIYLFNQIDETNKLIAEKIMQHKNFA